MTSPFLNLDYAANLAAVKRRINLAAAVAGRDASAVHLVAVSKTQTTETVAAMLAAGQIHFGENRVVEAVRKFAPLREAGRAFQLHLIGPLQTNKAEAAVGLFDVIETLDRPRLAEALAGAMAKTGRRPRLFVQVNIGKEAQKSGLPPEALTEFLAYCHDTCRLSVEGLMCIPPQADDPEPSFRAMKQLADRHRMAHISMGMSADYERAIACGATSVRVGTALFGKRPDL